MLLPPKDMKMKQLTLNLRLKVAQLALDVYADRNCCKLWYGRIEAG